jgi:ATP-binding cassette subfamily B protein/subfamily B ATP-binding cassette protein MsbA
VIRREFDQLRASMKLYARLGPYIRAEGRLLAVTVLVMLGATLLTLAQPWPLQAIIDSVLGDQPQPAWITVPLGELPRGSLLAVAIGLMVAAVLLTQALGLGQQYFSQLLGQRIVLRVRCELYAKLQRLSLRFHDRASVGDLIYRITGDANALQDIVTYGFVPLAIQLITALAITAVIFVLDVGLGMIALSIVPLLVIWTVWFSERLRKRSGRLARAESGLYTTTSEVLGAIRAVKSFVMEETEIRRFEERARLSQQAYVRVMAFSSLGGGVTNALAGLATAAVVFLGARAVLGGTLTVGELLVFVAYLQSLYGPITQVAGSALVVQKSAASIERVVQILDEEDEQGRPAGIRPSGVTGRVSYRNVWFSYDEARPVLRDVTLDVEAGERVAFVGRSGAGKTSLLSLLLRFYRPRSGRVVLDGADLESLDLTWLRKQIAIVLQEPIIFSGTLGENIAYGRAGATTAAIAAAARAAGLDEFVRSLPDGYDTAVGERGVRLSGGQRQRLSIARAFLKDAPILILDEPTSNLDATTEQQVFESLDRLARGRTTLVISHRLATVQRADRIVVLADGRVIEQGRHEDLLRSGGTYAGLYRDHVSAFRDPRDSIRPETRVIG